MYFTVFLTKNRSPPDKLQCYNGTWNVTITSNDLQEKVWCNKMTIVWCVKTNRLQNGKN